MPARVEGAARVLVALVLAFGCDGAPATHVTPDDGGAGAPADDATSPADAGDLATGPDAGTIIDPSAPALPDWVLGLPPGQWQAVSENTLADVDPEDDPALNPAFEDSDGDGDSERSAPWRLNSGQSCVLACWNGGAFASGHGESGALLVYGGGHAGYAGSEVYAFDMASRRWERVTDPWVDPSEIDPEHGVYPDGSPLPPHTYDGVGYDPSTNSFVVMRGIDDNHSGTLEANVQIAHMLDLETGRWRRSPHNPMGANLHGGSTAYDPNRGVLWQLGCYDTPLTAFDPRPDNGDGTFGSYVSYAAYPTSIDNAAAVDPIHDLLVYTAFRGSEQVNARFLDDPDRERVQLEQHGELPEYRGQNGWEWSNRLSGFVYWALGSDAVHSFTKDSDDREDLSWTWTLLTSADNTVTPDAPGNDTGPYSRFQLAAWGDVEVAVVVNDVDGEVYAFRIP